MIISISFHRLGEVWTYQSILATGRVSPHPGASPHTSALFAPVHVTALKNLPLPPVCQAHHKAVK